ncbi:GbsR/MarR family transcriptional regulator [Fulvimarina endophytica]|uniref:HTH-type transcriptional regulator n=1 Tax=Fulvimarina endophytica TaxID=2293836 RepID=A0A371X571_9HYPH|nr:GbsR/MarR family transcriptional regulator [Fulvimarina endophytica]RFC64194.1 GbsR/MarR family transcriptional regulator [Fulvimarina endophytica]
MQDHLIREFMLHFGEMGSRWGINRTVGQIYAVLFLSEAPLCADDLVTVTGFSRSNVSMGLKELQGWNLVSIRRIEGDRRDYFATPEDMWKIVRTLIAERKKREIDPTLSKLRELELSTRSESYSARRLTELREMIETMTEFYEEMNRIETKRLVALMKAGNRIGRLVGKTGQIIPFGRQRSDEAEEAGG